jgi:hypothetical protein
MTFWDKILSALQIDVAAFTVKPRADQGVSMRTPYAFLALALVASLLLPSIAQAQKKKPKPTIAPAEKLAEGWDEIDERLVFLMVRLANVEASLDAVEKRIGAGVRKKAVKSGDAKRAERGNELMDRKGGGPMKWSEFYGTTAENFFYHPTDRNSTYHTETILRQQGSDADNKVGGGVPAGQGLPVHQRPPQFDYIYRANEKAKERAEEEAAALKGKVEQLAQRRQRLESEQAGLWCEIAFRAVSHYDLDKKPLYRFQPIAGNDTESRRNTDSMKEAASFMALALSVMTAAEKDQAATFSKIKPAVSEARQKLNDDWLQLGVDVTDRYTTEGKFASLAKRLDDVASNLSDSYVVAMEGDAAHDQERKDTFRALLQESLVKYARIVLALDEMSTVMKNDWKIKPDVGTPIQFVSLTKVEPVRSTTADLASSPTVIVDTPTEPETHEDEGFVSLFDGKSLAGWVGDTRLWRVVDGAIVGETPGKLDNFTWLYTKANFDNFILKVKFNLVAGNSGINFRSEPQPSFRLKGKQADVLYGNFKWMGALCDDSGGESNNIFPSEESRRVLMDTIKQDGWNDVVILADGKHMRLEYDGITTVDTFSEGWKPGVIGFQLINGRVSFKDISIKKLTPKR